MSELIDAPEFQKSVEDLVAKLEELAERKMTLNKSLLNLDVEMAYLVSVISLKAMKELGRI
jgi:hypothetical protein